MTRPPQNPIADFELERTFARWEFNVRHVLCASDVEPWRLEDLLALADDETRLLWRDLRLGYTETTGHPLLRREIAGLYDRIAPEEVLCFAGAQEAIYATMCVLLRPGDRVVATWPAYQSLHSVAEAIGAEVVRWPLRVSAGNPDQREWRLDLDELASVLRPGARLVVTNFPHNPTGALPSRAEWQRLAALVRESGAWLFADEVYRGLELDERDRLPAAADLHECALSLGVMSKPYGLAGLRVGWLACRDAPIRQALASFKDYTTICNSAPAEVLALIALRAHDRVLARSLGLIRKNLALIEAFMDRHRDRFEWLPPRAGSTAFPRWLGATPVDEICEALAREQGVMLLPGTVFGVGDGHFRLGLGRADTAAALERCERFLSNHWYLFYVKR